MQTPLAPEVGMGKPNADPVRHPTPATSTGSVKNITGA